MVEWARAITVSFVNNAQDSIDITTHQIGLWPVHSNTPTPSTTGAARADGFESDGDN
jgi:hypothetical protein